MTPLAAGFDPADPGFVADPYPTYARLRQAPVGWHEPTGLWLVSRHADVDAALRNRSLHRVFTPRRPADRFHDWNLVNERAMLELEPPEHTRQRRLVAAAFTPRRVERLRPKIRALADSLLDAALDGGQVELVGGLAEPLPVAVIAELLGVPAADRPLLRPWSNAIVGLYELTPDETVAERAATAAAEFVGYLRDLIAVRRRTPGEDLLSALVAATDGGDRLAEDEVVAVGVLLLNAGHEATVNVIGNGVLALLRRPDQLDRLRRRPDLLPAAADECIRYDTPLSLFQRTAVADVGIGGVSVPAGQRVGVLLGSANRDGEVFDRPDGFDAGRRPNPHLGFGAGIHYCLGAPLARVEVVEAVAALLARFPRLELAAEPPLRSSFQFRGVRELTVAVG
jgi:cytochrome P450